MNFPTFIKKKLKTTYCGTKMKTKQNKKKRSWIGQCEQLKDCDLIIFENAKDVKSVKPIPHLQILAREFIDERDPKILIFKDKNTRFRDMSK